MNHFEIVREFIQHIIGSPFLIGRNVKSCYYAILKGLYRVKYMVKDKFELIV